jgi:hypothetical protein
MIMLAYLGREVQCYAEKRKHQGHHLHQPCEFLSIALVYLADDEFLALLFNQSDVPCLKSKTGHFN